jgi:ribose transport system permease protein
VNQHARAGSITVNGQPVDPGTNDDGGLAASVNDGSLMTDVDRRDEAHGTQRALAPTVERIVLPLMLVAVIVVFALLPATADSFLTAANFRTVLSNQAVIGLAALAVIPSIASGYYDLSIGANVGASAMAAAGAARAGWSMPAVIAAAMVVGLIIGIVNGSLVAYLHIDSLITTIGTSTVIGALVLWYSDSATIIAPFPRSVTRAVNSTWLGLPKVVWYLAGVALVVYFILDHTPLGRYFQALGSNKAAARLVGLNVSRLSVVSLAITGLGAGIAGVVIAVQNGSVSPQTGPGYTLVALSAVFLGSTCIQPGRFNVPGTIIAVYFVALIVNGLTLAGAAAWVNPLFNGLALLIAVALSVAVRRGHR